MFRSLRLRNFKSWKDSNPLELRKFTVFFGGNSSGKTSLLQSLLVLKQTVESPDRKPVLHLGDKNTPVDRKFVAAAHAAPDVVTIVQGTDVKWWGWSHALEELGIPVQFLCKEELQERWNAIYG